LPARDTTTVSAALYRTGASDEYIAFNYNAIGGIDTLMSWAYARGSGIIKNITGGVQYQIPYQTNVSTTGFINVPNATYNSVLTFNTDGLLEFQYKRLTENNTASSVVWRDASGNFAAGTITATLSGNASTVTNGVYTNGSYANPPWITSLAPSKVGLDTTKIGYLAKSNSWTGANNFSLGVNFGVSSISEGSLIIRNVNNNYYTTLYSTTETSSKTIYFPNADGTIALAATTLAGYGITDGVSLSANNSFSGNNTFTGDVIATQEAVAVATGTISVAGMTWVKLETTGGNRTVSTINTGVDGKIISLYSNDGTYTITFDEAGNLQLGGTSFVMSDNDSITLRYSTTKSKWIELSRSDN
jgi:hypothetical protein